MKIGEDMQCNLYVAHAVLSTVRITTKYGMRSSKGQIAQNYQYLSEGKSYLSIEIKYIEYLNKIQKSHPVSNLDFFQQPNDIFFYFNSKELNILQNTFFSFFIFFFLKLFNELNRRLQFV